jgi:hypothetical protein
MRNTSSCAITHRPGHPDEGFVGCVVLVDRGYPRQPSEHRDGRLRSNTALPVPPICTLQRAGVSGCIREPFGGRLGDVDRLIPEMGYSSMGIIKTRTSRVGHYESSAPSSARRRSRHGTQNGPNCDIIFDIARSGCNPHGGMGRPGEAGTLHCFFCGNELAGEVGEALERALETIAFAAAIGRPSNIIKKLDRELGMAGSRASVDYLADAMICIRRLEVKIGLDLDVAVVRKFNTKSEDLGSQDSYRRTDQAGGSLLLQAVRGGLPQGGPLQAAQPTGAHCHDSGPSRRRHPGTASGRAAYLPPRPCAPRGPPRQQSVK